MIEDLLTPLQPQPQSDLAPLVRAADLLLLLDRWVERGWLRALDKAFVGFLHELEPQGDPLVLMAAALTSHQLGHGHVCLDLFETLKEPDFALSLPPEGDLQSTAAVLPSQVLATLDGAHWCKALAASRLVALAADQSEQARQRPLVLSGKRLYLRRYWAYERRIDNALRQRLAVQEETPRTWPSASAACSARPRRQGRSTGRSSPVPWPLVVPSASLPVGPVPVKPPLWCACWPCFRRRLSKPASLCVSASRHPPARRRRV